MATVDEILDRAIAVGTEKSSAATTAASAATTAASGYAVLSAPQLEPLPAVIEPPVNIPVNASGVDTALYGSTYDRIIQDLSDKFANFFTEFFPSDPALLESAQDWLAMAISQGGSGINATVEDQIWQRDRDRLTRAAASSSDEAVTEMAARGFPMPPGALNGRLMQIARERDSKIADQSRDRAIKTWEQEIENVKFAIGQVIDLRVRSIAAAGDYIRAMALAPQIASQLSVSSASAQANLISAASSFYSARIRMAELKFTPDRLNAEMTLQAGGKNLDGFNDRIKVQASTAVAIAQSLGSQAASALNAVNGTVQRLLQED